LEKDYDIEFKTLNISGLSTKELSDLRNSNTAFEDDWESPMLITIKDGKEVSNIKGYKEYQVLKKFVEYSINNNFYGQKDLGSGKLITIRELIEKIERVVKNNLIIEDKKNKEDIFCHLAKNKIAKKINLTPIKDGLKETLKFYEKNIKLIRGIS